MLPKLKINIVNVSRFLLIFLYFRSVFIMENGARIGLGASRKREKCKSDAGRESYVEKVLCIRVVGYEA